VSIKIDDGFMSLEIDGKVIATATERAGGWWEVTGWPRFFDRNQAITALTVTELLESGPVHRGRPDSGSEHAHSRCSLRNQHVAALAHWCLGVGITATIGANLAHGIGHGPIGALVSAWPALALAGSFELLMTLTRTEHRPIATQPPMASASAVAPVVERDRRAIQTRTRSKVIHLGGRPPRSFPSRIYGGCGRVQRHAPARVLEASDMEETLAGHQEWVAAGRPGAVSHEEAMAELFGGR
jgi:hypothetical protein